MSNVTGVATISEVDLYTSNTQPDYTFTLGQKVYGKYGKAFRYFLAGATTVEGNLYQGPAIDTQFDALVCPVTAVGSRTVTVTNGTTAVTAGQFVGGNIVVNVTPQLSEEYTIVGHSTAANGATWTLELDRPLRTAWTAATRVVARRSPWSGSIKTPGTTLTGSIAGCSIYPVTSAQYGWLQVEGVGGVVADSTSILVGSELGGNSTTAGAATLLTAGMAHIGYALQAANSGKPIPAFFNIG
jgi:hypothetical protein